ncbi:MAG TPA: M20/M25/M40 family metallo-hydrolase [Polyangia bacterium]|jgi:acetylornithine deacetylase|nr:M20/M25/M40 family metallo-hydrolase [Polyangia bacterium]
MALVDRLAELVSFDTQNPAGEERPLVHRLAGELAALGARTVDEVEVGDHAYVYARFGEGPPRLLVNAHLDTVPANSGYTAPPHLLVQRGDRLHGLGTADTKGAIAAVLEVLGERKPGRPVGILFSGDEEHGGSCMDAFLASAAAEGLERAIVCEPTGCRVGVRHRGIGAATVSLGGPGGHSSLVDRLVNPVAVLARAAVALDEMGIAHRGLGPAGFPGINLNVAALDGGIAFNVIPTRATLSFSLRPAPGTRIEELFAEAEQRVRAAAAPQAIEWTLVKASLPFATRDLAAFAPLLGDRLGDVVDLGFWTEAARFSEHGIDAVVFGPGDVGQAHAADEFVTLADLETARATFATVLH